MNVVPVATSTAFTVIVAAAAWSPVTGAGALRVAVFVVVAVAAALVAGVFGVVCKRKKEIKV